MTGHWLHLYLYNNPLGQGEPPLSTNYLKGGEYTQRWGKEIPRGLVTDNFQHMELIFVFYLLATPMMNESYFVKTKFMLIITNQWTFWYTGFPDKC